MMQPREIIDEVKSHPPLQREAAEESYVGRPVKWRVKFYNARVDREQIRISSFSCEQNCLLVVFYVDKDKYPELTHLHEDQELTVEGIIKKVDTISINLKDARLLFGGAAHSAEGVTTRDGVPIKDVLEKHPAKETAKVSQFFPWMRWEAVLPVLTFIVALVSIPYWPSWFGYEKGIDGSESSKEKEGGGETKKADSATMMLRPLEPLETGKQISELPNGVYFYDTAFAVEYEINEPDTDFIEAKNRKDPNIDFEIQKIDGRYYVVGFLSDELYSNIATVSSENTLYGVLSPNEWGGARHPVAIPFDAVYAVRSRTIYLDESAQMDILDIGFREVRDNPEAHP